MCTVRCFTPAKGSKPGNIQPHFERSSSKTKSCKQIIKFYQMILSSLFLTKNKGILHHITSLLNDERKTFKRKKVVERGGGDNPLNSKPTRNHTRLC